MNTLGLCGAQLHGREPLSDVRWIRRRVPFVIQGFAAGDPALAAVGNGPVDIVLVDADARLGHCVRLGTRRRGAAGRAAAARRRPAPARTSAQAIQRVRPWGVDVSTGVETTPGSGHKDARKLRRFIEEAHRGGRRRWAATAGPPTPRPPPTTGWPTGRELRQSAVA